MPKERYAEKVQVREISLTKHEIRGILADWVRMQISNSYDFDYARPIFVSTLDGGLMIRFIQAAVTTTEDMRGITTTSIGAFVAREAQRQAADAVRETQRHAAELKRAGGTGQPTDAARPGNPPDLPDEPED